MFDTWLAVEKPGAKISLKSSGSLRAASSAIRPFSTALARIAALSRPLPSSRTLTSTLEPACSAESSMVPPAGLPAEMRASGLSMPWSRLLRIRCTSGSPSFSSTVLSSSVSPPRVLNSISLPSSAERSRTRRLKRPKVEPIGSMRMLMVFSRSSAESRSTSSATPRISASLRFRASWLRRAWTITSSPTRLTSSSSLSEATRRLAAASVVLAAFWRTCSCSAKAEFRLAGLTSSFSMRIWPRRACSAKASARLAGSSSPRSIRISPRRRSGSSFRRVSRMKLRSSTKMNTSRMLASWASVVRKISQSA
ncbi:MAG: hypothetical protein BWY87_00962 [Deltaproteobacteria bacterium ADurb.Bin510]|nr:MAG: hypothetical protein BWY87_00962 [Deltaproteobacteria bacterium ADurb.Bin510]